MTYKFRKAAGVRREAKLSPCLASPYALRLTPYGEVAR
jgi:hypothetical protein